MDDRTVAGGQSKTPLELSAEELELVRTALRLLEATLGREEAEELADVQALIRRLGAPERS